MQRLHPELKFQVTQMSCGLAGYTKRNSSSFPWLLKRKTVILIQLGKIFLGKNINIEVFKWKPLSLQFHIGKNLKRLDNLDSKFVEAKQALIEEIQRQKSWSNS